MENDIVSAETSTEGVPEFTNSEIERLQNVLIRPFSRSQRFIYCGLLNEPDTFVTGSLSHVKIKMGTSEHVCAVVKIHDKEVLDILNRVFKLLDIDPTKLPMKFLDLPKFLSVMKKHKYIYANTGIRKDGRKIGYDLKIKDKVTFDIICEPAATHFTYIVIEQLVAKLFCDGAAWDKLHLIPLDRTIIKTDSAIQVKLLPEDFKGGPLDGLIDVGIKFTITKCRDMLDITPILPKSTVKNPVPPEELEKYVNGCCMWHHTECEFSYGGYIRSPVVDILVSRLNSPLSCFRRKS